MCYPKKRPTMRTLIILLLGLTIVSCSQTQTSQDKIVTQDTISKTVANKETALEKITRLLDEALTVDTLEFNNEFETNQSFLFFKSGRIISKSEKNALVVVCPTDTTYMVRLY